MVVCKSAFPRKKGHPRNQSRVPTTGRDVLDSTNCICSALPRNTDTTRLLPKNCRGDPGPGDPVWQRPPAGQASHQDGFSRCDGKDWTATSMIYLGGTRGSQIQLGPVRCQGTFSKLSWNCLLLSGLLDGSVALLSGAATSSGASTCGRMPRKTSWHASEDAVATFNRELPAPRNISLPRPRLTTHRKDLRHEQQQRLIQVTKVLTQNSQLSHCALDPIPSFI